MRFLVVIPTIRRSLPGFDENMARLQETFTHPTELAVLDGKAGKAQTLNKAYDILLRRHRCDIYVTMDDDYQPAKGWQEAIVTGFRVMPRCGVIGLWFGEDPVMLKYANFEHTLPPENFGGVRVRRMQQNQSIPGAMLAFRRKVALSIGKTPTGGEKYQFYEDGYRCVRSWALGWTVAYVEMAFPPVMVHYPDPATYEASKQADIKACQTVYEEYLHEAARRPLLRRILGKLKRARNGAGP